MAKQDFINRWKVNWTQVTDVSMEAICTIQNRAGNAVHFTFKHPGFGLAYEGASVGVYVPSSDKVKLTVHHRQDLIFRLQNGGLLVEVEEVTVGSEERMIGVEERSEFPPTRVLEAGEWGAEVDPQTPVPC